MNSKEPSFLADNNSITSLITQLHNYFHNCYSRDKITRSNLISHMEAADSDQAIELQRQLRALDEELTLLGILSDSLAISDRLLHMRSVRKKLDPTSPVYKVHHDQPSNIPDLTA
jgi:hypothetical protein